jgi:hypothetical protein
MGGNDGFCDDDADVYPQEDCWSWTIDDLALMYPGGPRGGGSRAGRGREWTRSYRPHLLQSCRIWDDEGTSK